MKNCSRTFLFAMPAMLLCCHLVYSQPFSFPIGGRDDPSKPNAEQNRNYSLLRMNLRNGAVDTLISGAGTIRGLFEGSDQKRVFLEYDGELAMVDVDAPQNIRTFEFDIRHRVSGFLDAYKVNKVFFTIQDQYSEDADSNEYTMVFDRNTFTRIDSVRDYLVASRPGGEPIDFLSRDQNLIYRRLVQKGGIFFEVYSTSSHRRIGSRRCGTLADLQYGPAFEWGRNGVAIESYSDGTVGDFAGLKYVICDVDAATTPHVVSFPFRSEVSLSADGGRMIIEEVPWIDGRGPAPSGRFSIFSTTAGTLMQRIYLAPGSRPYVYENFPSEIIFFDPMTKRIDAINANTESSLPDLLDTLVAIKHRAAASSWLADANFVKELDNGLENAKKHLTNRDSVNAYKEVQTFQDKMNKEYEKTIDNQKKGKPRDRRFVTVEGWKFLYYNAQYIMDRLPSGMKK